MLISNAEDEDLQMNMNDGGTTSHLESLLLYNDKWLRVQINMLIISTQCAIKNSILMEI